MTDPTAPYAPFIMAVLVSAAAYGWALFITRGSRRRERARKARKHETQPAE